jgi:ribosomal protein L24
VIHSFNLSTQRAKAHRSQDPEAILVCIVSSIPASNIMIFCQTKTNKKQKRTKTKTRTRTKAKQTKHSYQPTKQTKY